MASGAWIFFVTFGVVFVFFAAMVWITGDPVWPFYGGGRDRHRECLENIARLEYELGFTDEMPISMLDG